MSSIRIYQNPTNSPSVLTSSPHLAIEHRLTVDTMTLYDTFIDPASDNVFRVREASPPYTPPSARISHPLLRTPNQRLRDLTWRSGVGRQRVVPYFGGKKPEVSRFLKLRIGKFVESMGVLRFSTRAKWICIFFVFQCNENQRLGEVNGKPKVPHQFQKSRVL